MNKTILKILLVFIIAFLSFAIVKYVIDKYVIYDIGQYLLSCLEFSIGFTFFYILLVILPKEIKHKNKKHQHKISYKLYKT
jgi:hypothetical protein